MALNVGPPSLTSLFVTDLDLDVNEAQLYDIFNAIGPVASIRVCRDSVTRRSLGYAYVNYNSSVDQTAAERALEELNYTEVNGKVMRVMMSNRDPSTRKSGASNIFIKNLEETIDQKALHDTLSAFGKIVSCKVPLHLDGKSRGYGFVHFETEEAALLVIEKVNGMLINGKKVYVGKHIKKSEREVKESPITFTNVYVKNLDPEVTEDILKEKFAEIGTVTTATIMKDAEGKSRGFGFVNFEDPNCASKAVELLNGTEIGSLTIYCGRAMKKHERQEILRREFEERQRELAEKYQGSNLYIKNLDDSIDVEKLKEEFASFGTIQSARIMTDEKNISRGFGFVCFSSPEEAARAIKEANGRMVCGKPLFVTLAQRKEERKQQLAQMYSAYRIPAMAPGFMQPSVLPGASNIRPVMYHHPATGAPMYYSPQGGMLAAPTVIQQQQFQQQQPGVLYQSQVSGQWRPTSGPTPVQGSQPMGQFQNQSYSQANIRGQRNGQRRPTGPYNSQVVQPLVGQQPQVSVRDIPRSQHQQRHQRQPIRYTGPSANNTTGIYPVHPQIIAQPLPATQPIITSPGSTSGGVPFPPVMGEMLNPAVLASVPPSHQKQILGERIFPLVQSQQPELAGKITGMLLEMDNSELLLLLESPEALVEKVKEAYAVLQQHGVGMSDIVDGVSS